MAAPGNTQTFTVLAQDPGVRGVNGELLLAQLQVPLETLWFGPTGYRVKVVDFNATTNKLYKAHQYVTGPDGKVVDPFAAIPSGVRARRKFDADLLASPQFHSQNVYAIVMRTLGRFEYALGRRVAWGFNGHQLHILPHAFVEANAFYSKEDRALMFGYFRRIDGGEGHVFTCLSHDIVVHETTHAVLDGLRTGFMNESGPDQAAFHEGFADVVALLSVFSLKEIVEFALTRGEKPAATRTDNIRLVAAKALSAKALADSILFGLGEEFGRNLDGIRVNALRRSVELKPSKRYLNDKEYDEPHYRGEVFAAAMLRSMLEMWVSRIKQLGSFGNDQYNLDAVIAEGAKAADHLLTIAIRALDYCPPLDLEFSDYLSALLTVDAEVAPDDDRFNYRELIRGTFKSFGIETDQDKTDGSGHWVPFETHADIHYQRTNFDSMLRDCEEVFRFIWENRAVLGIDERAYAQVISVRPSTRFGPDGFLLKETVCEYTLKANIFGAEFQSVCGEPLPEGFSTKQHLTLYGGGTLVFDQYGRIKYHIRRPLNDGHWQLKRLGYLWAMAPDSEAADSAGSFAGMHRVRAMSHSRVKGA